jgi:glycosyltransferase involved in cell wall biosynthesis
MPSREDAKSTKENNNSRVREMSANCLVSIVLPTYNRSYYLEQAIRSCLEQTYQHWELLIVDDASNDDTPSVIAKYAEKDGRIHSIRHDVNRKLPAALNTGFSHAKGMFLTWTSDDNLYRPDALLEMVDFLLANPEIDIICSDYATIDAEGNTTGHVSAGTFADIYEGNSIGPCFLYRRSVQDTLKYYAEDLFTAEDYDFWLRASEFFKAASLHKDLYIYRCHEDSLTLKYKEKCMKAKELVYSRHFERKPSIRRDIRAKCWIELFWVAYSIKNLRKTGKYFLLAVTSSPSYVYKHMYRAMSSRKAAKPTKNK